jgi:uncharacterized membrane protein YfcA
LIACASLGAGFIGALTGLGGGVILVPLLVLVFHVNLRYAIGASLISVIATSSGAASAYVAEGLSNVRIAMFLEVATVLGALLGAAAAAHVPVNAIAVVFGLVLLYSAFLSRSEPGTQELNIDDTDPIASFLRLDASYPTTSGAVSYRVHHTAYGFLVMCIAGVLSGLLGIGSGALKVLAMDRVMGLPFKVSTTTSNFMIGVTAAASAGVYLRRGYVEPALAAPVMLGVLAGSLIGAHVLARAEPRLLRVVFVGVIVALALEMLYDGLSGKLCC